MPAKLPAPAALETILANAHPLVTTLHRAVTGPALKNPRTLFLDLNPHLAEDPSFTDRYTGRKDAAVLIPVLLRADPTVLLTVRSPDMPSHAGQVSFPGGRVHADDPDHAFTALRETHEEVGIAPEEVTLIGDLGEHVGGLGYRVSPYVGLVREAASQRACPREVQEIFEVPLSFFADMKNHFYTEKNYKGTAYKMFYVPYKDYNIWGLTAGILRSLAERFQAIEST
ncbi:MAG: CoA pyrophosphatase [Pseudomonadota bacterium]